MKKYILGAVLAFGILVSPAFTQASSLTNDQINAIVSLLQSFGADSATIANVQTSLNGGTTTGGGTGAFCYNFDINLTVGNIGEGPSALNTALNLNGLTPSDFHSSTFTEDTATYVIAFQAKYGIRQTGYVGPITRAKLNSLYGCSSNFNPVITVLSPSSGPVGTTVTINGSGFGRGDTVYFQGQSVLATDNRNSPDPGNITSWSFVVPSVPVPPQRQCVPAVTGVMCEVRVANATGGGSSAWFHVTSSGKPSITVLSPTAGATFTQGQPMTIAWYSSPITNANSNYEIRYNTDFGGTGLATAIGTFSAAQAHCDAADKCSISWTPNFISQSVGIVVHDTTQGVSAGYGHSESFAIVAPTTTTPTITVLSPNGGEALNAGQKEIVRWSSRSMDSSKLLNIWLLDNPTRLGQLITSNVPNTGLATWQVNQLISLTDKNGNTITPSGKYVMFIECADHSCIVDDSDAPFSIVTPTTITTPITITSISPASGPVGTNIRLDGCGSDSTSGFTLVYTGPKSGTALIPIETLGAASGCGYMTITVPSDFPAGSYSLSVKNNQTGAMSTNNMAFTVTAPANNPVASVSPTSFVAGANFTSFITGAAPNTTIRVFVTGQDGVTSEDLPAGTTNPSGAFSRTHITTGWATGTYRGWVTVNGVQSNVVTFTVTTSGGGSGSSAKCTTSFSPKSIKAGDVATWNFQAGVGDTTFQYSCSGGGITKEDGTTLLSYGQLPLSGSWRIKITAPMDCTLDSYNPNVTGSGSQCRDIISPTFFIITTASLPNASANTSYSTTLATTNTGTMPYQWSWSPAVSGSGVLPAGLTLNSSTGIISGTPTTVGKYDVAIKVTDAAGNAPTKTLTLYVDAQAGVSTKCTTSISKTGDIYTWNFKAGAGATILQYSCSGGGIIKEDGTTLLSYGQLPLSGSWNIRVPGYGYLDCTLDSYNPNVTGSGSQCRANSNGFVLGNSTSQALAATFTYVWNRDLQIGSPYFDDVTALQKALTLNGEYAGELTGGFYNQTYAAVRAFQEKYGINATGYVGPLTRAELNTLFAR